MIGACKRRRIGASKTPIMLIAADAADASEASAAIGMTRMLECRSELATSAFCSHRKKRRRTVVSSDDHASPHSDGSDGCSEEVEVVLSATTVASGVSRNDAREDDDAAAAAVGPGRAQLDMKQGHQLLMVPQYADHIHANYREVEPRFRVMPADFRAKQKDVTPHMRAILVDWLVEVHLKFKLMPETLFLAVWLMDRYLAAEVVAKQDLQLVGITAMHLASKYQDRRGPLIRDYCDACDTTYTRSQVIEMERAMLAAVKFRLTAPTLQTFLPMYLNASGGLMDAEVVHLASLYCELSLVEQGMLEYPYSQVAAAAVHLALETVALVRGPRDAYPAALHKSSGYSKDDLLACRSELLELKERLASGKTTAVHRKYQKECFSAVACLPAPPLTPDGTGSRPLFTAGRLSSRLHEQAKRKMGEH